MKKIRCTLGTEEADLAQREVDIYQLFSHKNIIQLIVGSFLFFFEKNILTFLNRIQQQLPNLTEPKPFIYFYPILR
jgi:hypothetical protein